MTQEEKELLLKDLCARLPYGVKCQMEDKLIINDSPFYDYTLSERHIDLFRNHKDFYIKPYLRPLSSITEEEDKEWQYYKTAITKSCDERLEDRISELHDWFDAHHFDYRGLIEKGLAIAVTKENNPYEKEQKEK